MTDDLIARLAQLEAERDILRTLYRYAHTIDAGDAEGWADCFTADGVFHTTTRLEGYKPYRVQGRENLREFVEAHTRPPGLWHKHLLVEPLIEVDGDGASANSYFLVVMEHDDRPILRVFGRYVDRLRLEADGQWRFVERAPFVESMVPGLPPLAHGRELADAALAARMETDSGT